MGEAPDSKKTFTDHIAALRKRLMYPAALFLLGGTVAYFFYPQIIKFIRGSLNQPLYYDTPAGNFTLIMKICVLCGLSLAIPVLTYNVVRFVEPAFPKRIRRHTTLFVSLLALALALSGAAFALYVLVPMSLHFFEGFKIDGVQPLLSANEYLNFVLTAIISAMIMFQIPLVVPFIDFIHPIPPKKFLKFEKWVIVGSVGVALILPFTYDPITQFVVAIPIIGLYNLSILFIWVNHSSRKRRELRERKVAAKQTAPKAVPTTHTPAPAPVHHHQPQQRQRLQPRLISDMRPVSRRAMAASVSPKVLTEKVEPQMRTQFSAPQPKRIFDVYS